jgi:hypothetical protein
MNTNNDERPIRLPLQNGLDSVVQAGRRRLDLRSTARFLNSCLFVSLVVS